MTDAELNALVTRHITRGPWDRTQCPVCGWPLYDRVEDGCIRGNCSQRPTPTVRADAPVDYCGDRWPELFLFLAQAGRDPGIAGCGRQLYLGGVDRLIGSTRIQRCVAHDLSPGRALVIAALHAYDIVEDQP